MTKMISDVFKWIKNFLNKNNSSYQTEKYKKMLAADIERINTVKEKCLNYMEDNTSGWGFDFEYKVTPYKGYAVNYPVNTFLALEIKFQSNHSFFKGNGLSVGITPEDSVEKLITNFCKDLGYHQNGEVSFRLGSIGNREYNGNCIHTGSKGGYYYFSANNKKVYVKKEDTVINYEDSVKPFAMVEFWSDDEPVYLKDDKRVVPQLELEKLDLLKAED